MKVTLRKKIVNEVFLNGESLGCFEEKTELRGMKELVGEKGFIIINTEESSIGDIFSDIFAPDEKEEKEFQVVKCSSCFIKKPKPPPREILMAGKSKVQHRE